MSIEGFKHKGLSELFHNGTSRRITKNHHRKIIEILDILDATCSLKDLRGLSDFHALKGDRKGTYSMHINGNYVVTFKFLDGEVTDVNYEDYH